MDAPVAVAAAVGSEDGLECGRPWRGRKARTGWAWRHDSNCCAATPGSRADEADGVPGGLLNIGDHRVELNWGLVPGMTAFF